MEILKCPSCGAHINNNSKECVYCGSVFKNKKEEIIYEDKPSEPAKTIEINPISITTNTDSNLPSLLAIIISFIIFWPIGLFLLIQRISKKVN